MRRAFTALSVSYAVAWFLPAALAGLLDDSDPGVQPGYTVVSGRVQSCAGDFGCPTGPPDIGGILQDTGLALLPSLLVAVPLCAYLARGSRIPDLAGVGAALTGWMALCLFHLS
ncbi:hypothetical protein GCM10010112_90440 [Actinoplanes lobatus]|nr:hypothetical protein GCM10010112_90440 [Actinoplanes lobatus]GIE45802.1 hypothetical protein Alo02nite_87000 [Actinoplanes lobatus]